MTWIDPYKLNYFLVKMMVNKEKGKNNKNGLSGRNI
jgi:hypothetical protein